MTDRNTSKSPSPSTRSFSNKITAIGAKISRTLSNDRTLAGDRDRSRESAQSALMGSEIDRSVSRGRDVYQSSGRGGIGNIRNASASRDAKRPEDGPDDFSHSRGREPAPVHQQMNFSTGRGGAGNIRSPSRDVSQTPRTPEVREEEEEVIRAHAVADLDVPHSTGRGGAGNIASRSLSRGRALGQAPVAHSTGRGGAGNIVSGEAHALAAELEEETERMKHLHVDGIHSTGRGGSANLTTIQEPGIEKHGHKHGDFESTGRGGAGNIVHNRSRSRPRNGDV